MSYAAFRLFENCVYLQVQQTPKPLAQEPAEVPPLLVHSDLEIIKHAKLELKYIDRVPYFH